MLQFVVACAEQPKQADCAVAGAHLFWSYCKSPHRVSSPGGAMADHLLRGTAAIVIISISVVLFLLQYITMQYICLIVCVNLLIYQAPAASSGLNGIRAVEPRNASWLPHADLLVVVRNLSS